MPSDISIGDVSDRSTPSLFSTEDGLHPRQPTYGVDGFIFRPEDAVGYQLAPQLDSKTSRRRRAWVWQHGTLVQDAKQQQYWLCCRCKPTISYMKPANRKGHGVIPPVVRSAASTSHAISHMVDTHGFNRQGEEPCEEEDVIATKGLPTHRVEFYQYREYLVAFVVLDNISFSGASSERLIRLVSLLNPIATSLHPTSPTTVSKWVIEDAKIMSKRIKHALHTAASNISLTLDIWTSPNYIAFLGIEAHFIDQNGKLQNLLIAFRMLLGPHTGENIASVVIATVESYNITSHITYTTMDNASNNDTFAQHFYNYLDKNWKLFRLRCGCHIINLAAKNGLYGNMHAKASLYSTEEAASWHARSNKEAEQFAAEIHAEQVEEKAVQKQHEAWRQKGPVGMLRNLAIHAMMTPQRREAFRDAQRATNDDQGLYLYSLVKENATRWNSTYEMIKCGR